MAPVQSETRGVNTLHGSTAHYTPDSEWREVSAPVPRPPRASSGCRVPAETLKATPAPCPASYHHPCLPRLLDHDCWATRVYRISFRRRCSPSAPAPYCSREPEHTDSGESVSWLTCVVLCSVVSIMQKEKQQRALTQRSCSEVLSRDDICPSAVRTEQLIPPPFVLEKLLLPSPAQLSVNGASCLTSILLMRACVEMCVRARQRTSLQLLSRHNNSRERTEPRPAECLRITRR